MSDVSATTQTSVAAPDTETHFENLWSAGAFSADGEKPRDDDGAQGAGQDGAQAGQNDLGAARQDDGTQQAGDDAQDAQTGDDAPAYTSLDHLLTTLKVDPNSALSLPVTVKIDGQEKQVPLQDVIKSFQLEGHVNNKSIELSNQRTQFEQERQAVRQLAQQQIQQNQALGQAALQMLNHDYAKVDWNALRVQNPAEFAAMQTEFQQRQGQIQNYLGQIQQQTAQQAQVQQQNLQQSLAAENDRLMNLRPEWRDQKSFTKDREQMTQYARTLGFQDAELSQIFDHRYMLILHDAARYQALQAATPQALKQVRQAPVMAAPGSRTDANPQDARRSAAIERFNRNPRDIDAQAAVFDFLG